jgi:nitrous oxidase accessory protein NosD
MKRRVAVMLGVALAAVGLAMGPSRAAGVLVVDNGTVPGSCAFGAADHATIQAAVLAADPGDRIRVCPGTYEETVEVPAHKHHLTIEGAKAGIDARRRSPRGEGESEVIAKSAGGVVRLLADHVVWDGFRIADNRAGRGGILGGPGMYTSPDASGYVIRNTVFVDNGLGLYLNASGKALTKVRRNRFTANNEFEEPNAGYGIYSDQGARCVLIADNRFEDHNGAGIFFADGDQPQHCVTVERNKSIGDRSFATFFASSHVRLVANFVSGRPDDPFPGSAIFIGARNKDVLVKRNHVEATAGNGIDVRDTGGNRVDGLPPRNVDVLKNKVRAAGQNGIDVSATGVGEYEVRGNLALHNGEVGIHAGRDTDDAAFARNLARGNRTLDCQDESTGDGTAGTDNTWRGNTGGSDNPPGICHAHLDKPKHKHKKKHRHKHKHKPKPCYPWRN